MRPTSALDKSRSDCNRKTQAQGSSASDDCSRAPYTIIGECSLNWITASKLLPTSSQYRQATHRSGVLQILIKVIVGQSVSDCWLCGLQCRSARFGEVVLQAPERLYGDAFWFLSSYGSCEMNCCVGRKSRTMEIKARHDSRGFERSSAVVSTCYTHPSFVFLSAESTAYLPTPSMDRHHTLPSHRGKPQNTWQLPKTPIDIVPNPCTHDIPIHCNLRHEVEPNSTNRRHALEWLQLKPISRGPRSPK